MYDEEPKEDNTDRNRTPPTSIVQHRAAVSTVHAIPHDLSNALSRLTLSYTDKIDPSIDISMQLVGNFGGFLTLIPPRLGRNESLDAAADVLISAYAHFRTGSLHPSSEVLIKHSRACSALGRCLNDPARASDSETLACVYLILICEVRSCFPENLQT